MKRTKEQGVTLVALVVTIIILVILAGVSINALLGDNGLITKAQQAKENMILAQVEEEASLNELYSQLENEDFSGDINYDAIAKLSEFKKTIADYIGEAGGIKPDYSAETITFGDSIKGIVKEVTKDATATADNLSKDVTAYVNGQKIVGNGTDVNNAKNASLANVEYNTVSTTQGYSSSSITRFTIDATNKTKLIVFYTGYSESGGAGRQLIIYADGTVIQTSNGSANVNLVSPYKYEIDISKYNTIVLSTYNGTADSKAAIFLSYVAY